MPNFPMHAIPEFAVIAWHGPGCPTVAMMGCRMAVYGARVYFHAIKPLRTIPKGCWEARKRKKKRCRLLDSTAQNHDAMEDVAEAKFSICYEKVRKLILQTVAPTRKHRKVRSLRCLLQ